MQKMKDADWDKLYGDADNQLDVKDASVLNKYFLAGMQLLTEGDAKVKNQVNYALLLKQQ